MRDWRAVFVSGLEGVAELNAMLAAGCILMREYPLPNGVLFILAPCRA